MDVSYFLRGQTFVWDQTKAKENFRKHHVRFETACEVFFDRDQESEDASVDDEIRFAVIGRTFDQIILYVVNVDREDEVIRIISARQANRREENLYENGS